MILEAGEPEAVCIPCPASPEKAIEPFACGSRAPSARGACLCQASPPAPAHAWRLPGCQPVWRKDAPEIAKTCVQRREVASHGG